MLEAAEAAGAAASGLGVTRAVRAAQARGIAAGRGDDDLTAVLFGVRAAIEHPSDQAQG